MAREAATSDSGEPPPSPSKVGYLLRQATEALVTRAEGQHTQARLRGLLDAVLSISEDLSLSAMLERVVAVAARLVDAGGAALAVRGSGGQAPSDVVSVGLSDDQIAAVRSGAGLAAALKVALRTRNQVFGDLYLVDKQGGRPFTEEDELMVVALASAAGVAIQNAQMFEAQSRRGLWLVASSEVRNAVLSGVEEDALEALVVAEARQAARAVFVVLVIPQPDGGMVITASTEPSLVGAELTAGTSFAERVTVEREAVVLEDIDRGHPATAVPDEVRARSGRCVIAPLGVAESGHGLGALIVVYPHDRDAVAELDLDYIVGFAGQAGVALELAAAQRDRERIAVLEDRERIARDLHDLVIQRLFAAGMTLQSTDSLVTNETARLRLEAVADDLDGTIRELRHAIYQLQAPVLADDFRNDVQQVVDRAVSGSSLKARIRYSGPVGTLIPDPARPHVLAVLGEALSNAVRHAAAATIDVTVSMDDTTLSVVVDDDGRGIDPAVTRRSGLANLETRANELGGGVTITGGSRGVGTRLSWTVPV